MPRIFALLLALAVGGSPVTTIDCAMVGFTGEASVTHGHDGHPPASDETGETEVPGTSDCTMIVACGAAGLAALPMLSAATPPIDRSDEPRITAPPANSSFLTKDPPPPRLPV